MRHLNDVSLAVRWWPVLVAGYRFHRNTGTCPIPLLKKNINKRQTLDLDSPKETFRIRATFKKHDKVFGMTL